MKVSLHVKPRSKQEGVERSADGSYVVRVKEPPVEGRVALQAVGEGCGQCKEPPGQDRFRSRVARQPTSRV